MFRRRRSEKKDYAYISLAVSLIYWLRPGVSVRRSRLSLSLPSGCKSVGSGSGWAENTRNRSNIRLRPTDEKKSEGMKNESMNLNPFSAKTVYFSFSIAEHRVVRNLSLDGFFEDYCHYDLALSIGSSPDSLARFSASPRYQLDFPKLPFITKSNQRARVLLMMLLSPSQRKPKWVDRGKVLNRAANGSPGLNDLASRRRSLEFLAYYGNTIHHCGLVYLEGAGGHFDHCLGGGIHFPTFFNLHSRERQSKFDPLRSIRSHATFEFLLPTKFIKSIFIFLRFVWKV